MVTTAYDTIKNWNKKTGDMATCMTQGGPNAAQTPGTQPRTDLDENSKVPQPIESLKGIGATCCKKNT